MCDNNIAGDDCWTVLFVHVLYIAEQYYKLSKKKPQKLRWAVKLKKKGDCIEIISNTNNN